MHDRMIDYLLDALDPDEVQDIEQFLDEAHEARRELENLRCGLARLVVYSFNDVGVPCGLAIRTCRHIREQSD